jgi:hypothetical protein
VHEGDERALFVVLDGRIEVVKLHWSIPDPAREPGNDEQTLPAFERTATELCTRIGFLIDAIEQTTTSQEVTERA